MQADKTRAAEMRTVPPEAWADAEDELLEDVDSYTDWLGAQCAGHGCERFTYVPYNKHALRRIADGMTAPALVAWLLYPNADVAGVAALVLRTRYVQEKQARVLCIAQRIQAERETLEMAGQE